MTTSDRTEMILQSSKAFIDSDVLLRVPVEDLGDDEVLMAWSFLDMIEKELVKKRKVALRDHLLELAREKGARNDKGSSIYQVQGTDGKVTRQRRRGKVTYAIEAVAKLADSLESSVVGFDRDELMVPTYSVSEQKLTELVDDGHVTQNDLKDITRISDATFALVVRKPSLITKLLGKKK